MPSEDLLIKASLIFSIVGIFALFLISRNTQLNETTIEKLGSKSIDETVRIKGILESVKRSDSATYLRISQNSSIEGVFFDKANLSAGDTVEVTGKISEYKGKRNIIIDSIIRR